MKKFIFISLSLLIILFSSCQQKNANHVNVKNETEAVKNVLEEYVMANENNDFNLIKQIWAPDSKIILFGTNSDEKLIGWNNIQKAIKKQFANFSHTYITVLHQDVNISKTGNTAWFAEILNYSFVYKGKARSYPGVRFTGVLEKRPDGWKLVQGHLSIPANSVNSFEK